MHVFWDARAAAAAITDLPASGPLPSRTVIVQNPRLAHALRRELAMLRLDRVLAGTVFVTVIEAAEAVLRRAGVSFSSGEEALRPSRLVSCFEGQIPLEYFDRRTLRETTGWEDAFAKTIGELEAATLRPADVRAAGPEPRWRDIATVWEALDASAGSSWTTARTVAEAGMALSSAPRRWPYAGPSLLLLFPDVSAGEALFSRAIPHGTMSLFGARPHRGSHMERLQALFGDIAAGALMLRAPNRLLDTERDVLASFLFEPPERLGAPERPRSTGADGTVQLEEHAGVEAEVEAAAEWVTRQILEHGAPLEEIAILFPRLDPLAALVTERLARLPWAGGTLPVYVAGGLSVAGTAAGARALAVVRALRAQLAAEALADVLPALRLTADGTRRHLSRDRAITLAYSLGTVGGDAGNPAGALEWTERARVREASLAARLSAAAPGEEGERGRREAEHQLADLRAIRPALEALVGLAALALDGTALEDLGAAVAAFLDDWTLAPGAGAPIGALLRSALDRMCAGGVGTLLRGETALRGVEDALRSLRLPHGRFGAPAVYVGALQSARGLRFAAVRVIGLAEGHCPSAPREDAVLPDALAGRLRNRGLRAAKDKALAQLHALDLAVRGARREIVLSFARLDVDRSNRESSSIYVEAAAALGRPDADGKRMPIPDTRSLHRDGFALARDAATVFRQAAPLAEATWQSRVALGGGAPAAWMTREHLGLERIRTLGAATGWGPLDGLLGDAGVVLPLPGLSPERPISASGLRKLLECPHRFLFETVLRWREPVAAPPTREIDPLSYGTLFHATLEAFAKQHGLGFGERRDSLDAWVARGDEVVEALFADFLETYPLVGTAVRAQQLRRLQSDVRRFLREEWRHPVRREFVAAEHAFGYGQPTVVEAPGLTLYVRGFIDRIDREGDYLLIRDLKTGKPKPRRGREQGPTAKLDLQIALYGMVARAMAAERGLRVGAGYVYTGLVRERERAFRDDFEALEQAAFAWLRAASGLLTARAFPRTPDPDDCAYCPFRPVCGDNANQRAAELLASATDEHLQVFRGTKEEGTGS